MSEVEIRLTAVDEATSVINQVAGNVDSANSQIEESSSSMAAGLEEANVSVKDSALGFNNLATSGMGLYMSFDRIQNSEVALDRAHVTLEKSTLAVEHAQDAYNATVAQYGPNSSQAQDAAAKLRIAEDAHEVAVERVDMAQRNMTNSMLMAAMTVIPSLITAVTSVSTITASFTGITEALGTAMDFLSANPIVLVIAGIAALVAGLIYAYNNCGLFRDAINAIANVLGGALSAAVNGIVAGLTWLWNNILKPLGTFLVAVLLAEWTALSNGLNWAYTNILKPVFDAIQAFYDDVIKPFADAIGGVVNTISGAANAVGGAMGGVASAVSGGLGAAGSSISGFIGSICFAHALENASNSSTKTMSCWTDMIKTSMDKGLGSIRDFNAQAGIMGMAVGSSPAPAAAPYAATAARQAPVTVNVNAPLVQVQGSADKATVDLASKQVLEQLRTVIIEPTSTSASTNQKRIRKGAIFT